ncbi:hypothetical protein EF405_21140 [Cyclobacteriaceae bacterium YHN15]|nr:hypothetical protein EF405_21140 [Cyclobacteriaceae bacterium YHN15]
MVSLKELTFDEKIRMDGGVVPLVVFGAYCVSALMVGVATDIVMNFNTYSTMLDEKLSNCK